MMDWDSVCARLTNWVSYESHFKSSWRVDLRIQQKATGDVADRASITVDTGSSGITVELWASGELDCTRLDFNRLSEPGVIETFNFESTDRLLAILNQCFFNEKS